MQGGNKTRVSIGVFAGSLISAIVIVLNTYAGMNPPISTELQALCTVLFTAACQWFLPGSE